MSNSLWPHRLQYARLPCSSSSPEACSNHGHWVCDAIQPSHPLSSLLVPPSIFPSIRTPFQWVGASHQMAKVLGLQHQSFQWMFSVDFLQDSLVWSPCYARNSQESSPTPQSKHINSLVLSLFYCLALISIHDYWKTIALTLWTFVSKVMPLFLDMLSRFVIAFLPRSKCIFISWLQSPSTVILEPKKIKSVTVFIVAPSLYHEVMGLNALIFVFWLLNLNQLFHSPLSPSSTGCLIPLHFLPWG